MNGGTTVVLVTGSRTWQDADAIRTRLAQLPPGSVVMHGSAFGADRLAAQVADELGLSVVAFPARWSTEGKCAGVLRNLRMLDQRPDVVLAFWDGESRGTRHCIEAAIKRGIPVEVA